MEVTLTELAAGGGLFALVLAAVVRVLQGDRDWKALVDAERESRESAEERAEKELVRRVAVEAELHLVRQEMRALDEANRDLRAAMRTLGTRVDDEIDSLGRRVIKQARRRRDDPSPLPGENGDGS